MRVLIAAFSLIVAVCSYDAVFFSNQRDISSSSIEDIVKSASAENPVVFITNPDFSLGQFSVKANAYTSEPTTNYLAKSVKSSKYHGSQYVANQIQTESAQVITSADQFTSGASIYILAGEEWTSMDQLSEQLLSKVDNAVAVITSSDAVEHNKNRVKRVVTADMEEDAATGNTAAPNGKYISFPAVLPPYNVTDFPIQPTNDQTCLLYLEGLTIVAMAKNEKLNSFAAASIPYNNLTWSYNDGDVTCPNGTIGSFLFRVRAKTSTDVKGFTDTKEAFTIAAGTPIDFSLNITGDYFGYWQLTGMTGNDISITSTSGSGVSYTGKVQGDKAGKQATSYSGIDSVAGFSVTCQQSQAVFFNTGDANLKIGVALANFQIQLFQPNLDKWTESVRFTMQTEDCTGTFSPGSWMGIISALVLVSGLIFGYLMLQSVQTMDRFDDPKQKQIVINVRE